MVNTYLLIFPVDFPALRGAECLHEFEAFFRVEVACFGISLRHPAVHLRRCRQAFKILASRLNVERSDRHAVEVNQFELDGAVGLLFEEDVGASVVFVGQSVFVQFGRQPSDGPQHVGLIAEMLFKERFVAVGAV